MELRVQPLRLHQQPIILDLDGNGYRFTDASTGVVFDIDADGTADAVAWTLAGGADGFLVLDRNGNGTIDDASEMFSTATPSSGGGLPTDGFAALAELDGNRDGRVDQNDATYSQLRVWIDLNHNGFSESTELRSLSEAGVTAFFLDYELTGRRDRHGNLFWLKGSALIERRGVPRRRPIFDVVLKTW